MIKKIYYCDRCGKSIGERAGKVSITDINGTTATLDVCDKCAMEVVGVFRGSDLYDDIFDILAPEDDWLESLPTGQDSGEATAASDGEKTEPVSDEAEQPETIALQERVLEVNESETVDPEETDMGCPAPEEPAEPEAPEPEAKKKPAAKKTRKKMDIGKMCALKRAGWKNKAIAEEMGYTESTIATTLSRLKKEGKIS